MENGYSRRTFLKGAAFATTGALAGFTTLAGCAPQASGQGGVQAATEGTPFENTVEWDAEYDVIVCGFGASGACAAIGAADNGAKVLLLEKGDATLAGGNSRYGQNFMAYTDRDLAIQYMKNMRGGHTEVQGDDVIEFLVDGFMSFHDWLIDHGLPEEHIKYATRPEYPELWPNGEDTEGFRKITIRTDERFGADRLNANLAFFTSVIKDNRDQIDVWYASSADALVQDPFTKTIHGVKTTHDGKQYTVRAKNGVVLATGGFENNLEMIQNFTGYEEMFAKGCHLNTGDSVAMAAEAGAQLWHMANLAAPDPNFISPYTGIAYDWNCASDGNIGKTSAIFVAGDGTRFMNECAEETFNSRHGKTNFHGTWVHMPWPRNTWMIADENARTTGHAPYSFWSEGWENELAQGWLVQADTLEALADKIGIDGEALASTVERYNRLCEQGLDEDWGRDPEGLVAFSGQGPFYAMEMKPCVTNTDGGAKRNTKCEVLDPRDEPIPHLYSAGSFGSFLIGDYNGGGNMGECFVSGTEAGKNAATVKDDVSQESALSKDAVNFACTWEDTPFDTADGQYLGRYGGRGGTLTVRVTVDGQKIENIEVMEEHETKGIGSRAVEAMPQRIVDAQSTDVDTVSGATATSAAIILATEQALKEAGVALKTSGDKTETPQ